MSSRAWIALARFATDLGLGEKTGIGINTETRGFIPTKGWYEQRGEAYRVGYTLNTAIGQGNTRVSLIAAGHGVCGPGQRRHRRTCRSWSESVQRPTAPCWSALHRVSAAQLNYNARRTST